MPSVSRRQQRAMFAAAGGRGTIGIPEKVGKEFAAADISEGTDEERYAGRSRRGNKGAKSRTHKTTSRVGPR